MMMMMAVSPFSVLLPAGSLADVQLAKLLSVMGLLAIPLGVLLLAVFYQLMLLLINTVECLTMAKYEVAPTLHHCKNIAQQVDDIATRVNASAKAVETSVSKTMETGEKLADSTTKTLVALGRWFKSCFN
jgi:hypothetical protein